MSEQRVQASGAPYHQVCAPLSSQRTMAPRIVTRLSLNEADIKLAHRSKAIFLLQQSIM
jgi:hypothetical protein